MALADEVRKVLADTMNLPPELLSFLPQYVAQNPVSTARISGSVITSSKTTTNVTTAGTTFGTGADLLAAPLAFTADGRSDYIVRVIGRDCQNSVATARCIFRLNLDGNDQGIIADIASPTASASAACAFSGVVSAPSAGSHTVNVRLVPTAGTGTVEAGSGGAGLSTPLLVTLEVA